MIRPSACLAAGLAMGLSACAPAAPASTADMACETAIEIASGLLPDEALAHPDSIEAGQSGQAVSCAVTTREARLMIDATVTCDGTDETFDTCTVIDAILDMNGRTLYP